MFLDHVAALEKIIESLTRLQRTLEAAPENDEALMHLRAASEALRARNKRRAMEMP